MRPGAVAFAASEKFICALGGHTQYFVKEPEKVFELKMEAKKKPPRSAINMLMRLVLYPVRAFFLRLMTIFISLVDVISCLYRLGIGSNGQNL